MVDIAESESHQVLKAKREQCLAYESQEREAASQVEGGWHVSAASVRGPSHIRSGDPRQDAFGFAITGETLVGCVADGLGSQGRSHIGSWIASTQVSADVAAAIEGMGPDDRATALAEGGEGMLGEVVRGAVSRAARDAEALMQMTPGPGFATTLVGVVAGPEGGFFFHVGDGAALAYAEEPFGELPAPAEPADPDPITPIEAELSGPVVSPPENGEFADITYAIDTDPNDRHLRFTSFPAGRFIVLMTDGPMGFALTREQDALAEGLFRPVAAHLASPAGQAQGGRLLTKILLDPRASEISDDDKTLMVLRRID